MKTVYPPQTKFAGVYKGLKSFQYCPSGEQDVNKKFYFPFLKCNLKSENREMVYHCHSVPALGV